MRNKEIRKLKKTLLRLQRERPEGQRHLALIFNHRRFDLAYLKERRGTDRDVENLEKVLPLAGYVVHTCQDLTLKGISQVVSLLKDTAEQLDGLELYFLTHGSENWTLLARDGRYTLSDAVLAELGPEGCPALTTKPRLVFLQSCQGDLVEEKKTGGGVIIRRVADSRQVGFVVFQATRDGYQSYRSTTLGSIFIWSYCKVLADAVALNRLRPAGGSRYRLLDIILLTARRVMETTRVNTTVPGLQTPQLTIFVKGMLSS